MSASAGTRASAAPATQPAATTLSGRRNHWLTENCKLDHADGSLLCELGVHRYPFTADIRLGNGLRLRVTHRQGSPRLRLVNAANHDEILLVATRQVCAGGLAYVLDRRGGPRLRMQLRSRDADVFDVIELHQRATTASADGGVRRSASASGSDTNTNSDGETDSDSPSAARARGDDAIERHASTRAMQDNDNAPLNATVVRSCDGLPTAEMEAAAAAGAQLDDSAETATTASSTTETMLIAVFTGHRVSRKYTIDLRKPIDDISMSMLFFLFILMKKMRKYGVLDLPEINSNTGAAVLAAATPAMLAGTTASAI